jgi:hypothetical protein
VAVVVVVVVLLVVEMSATFKPTLTKATMDPTEAWRFVERVASGVRATEYVAHPLVLSNV